MSCSGLHCASCAGGISVPPMALAATLGLAWVAEHLIEIAVVSAACGLLSVAAVVALMRWADRRDARHAARSSLFTVRADVIPMAATVIPQVSRHAQAPALEQHVHFHFDPADREAARIIRTALPGLSGAIITEE